MISLFIAIYMFHYVFGRVTKHREIKEDEWLNFQDKEEITLESFDKLKLKAWLILNKKETNKFVIFHHGYKGFIGGLSGIAQGLNEMGFNVLLVQTRGHHISEGKYFTMGPYEKKDYKMWCDYIASRYPDSKIICHGWSMGAHTVMASLEEGINKNVKCVVEDCGYYDLFVQILDTFKSTMPKFPFKKYFMHCLSIYCKVFYHLNIHERLDKALENEIPMLFIHGRKDDFVPFSNLELCFNKKQGEKYMSIYENSGHTACYFDEKERFEKEYLEFVNRYTGE